MSNTDDRLNFTLSVKNTVRCWLNDPACREEIIAAINEGPVRTTEILGGCNRGTKETPEYWNVWSVCDQDKKPGERGLFYRNSFTDEQGVTHGKGDRVRMVLKKQKPKEDTAADPQVATLLKLIGSNPNAASVLQKLLGIAPEAPAAETPASSGTSMEDLAAAVAQIS
jgi:hypothetical protein